MFLFFFSKINSLDYFALLIFGPDPCIDWCVVMLTKNALRWTGYFLLSPVASFGRVTFDYVTDTPERFLPYLHHVRSLRSSFRFSPVAILQGPSPIPCSQKT